MTLNSWPHFDRDQIDSATRVLASGKVNTWTGRESKAFESEFAEWCGSSQAIAMANATDYGLSASIWTTDPDRAARVARRIEAGTVWVNCWLLRDLRVPFGGIKHSGVGREGGEEAMRFFTEAKTICTARSSG